MVQFSGRFKAGAPKARYMAGVRQKGYFGADDKVVLASTGREAYDAGGGFHRGAATTHATRHTECAWTERAAQQHTQSASSPSSKENQGGKRASASDAHPKRREIRRPAYDTALDFLPMLTRL